MAKTVVGLMDTAEEAQSVVRDLVDSGFKRESISVMTSDERGEGRDRTKDESGGAASGAMKGAGAGAVFGGVAGLLIGITGLAIPGIGPIVAAGPLATALAGAGIGAAAGGLIGALTGMGVPEEDAHYYAEGVRRGGVLVTVAADDAAADRAVDIMHRHGAVDIDKRAAQWKQTGWSRFDEKATPLTAQQMTKEREAVIPVVEEKVQIGKREAERGRVRVYSHVVETPVEERVTLREEHARVERRPADRPASASDREAFRETSYEVRETSEEPVVSKQARVVEEVVVGKEAGERVETVRDTVRRTDVAVERTGAEASSLDDETDFKSHFHSHAARGEDYDSYKTAYNFAGLLPRDNRYEGKEWSQVENDVHRDWETRHPGTWSKYKDAISYGWEKKTRRSAADRRR